MVVQNVVKSEGDYACVAPSSKNLDILMSTIIGDAFPNAGENDGDCESRGPHDCGRRVGLCWPIHPALAGLL